MHSRMTLRFSLAAAVALSLANVAPSAASDDLTAFSDEFDSPATISRWLRIYQTEGWGNNVLERFDIHTNRPGHAVMVPYTSSWYAEWRGELTYKIVTGDFVITTHVDTLNRAGTGAPASHFSLAGLMVRTPRTMTNATQWTPNSQNYIFLSLGSADNPGSFQFEVKTTINSVSTLHIRPATAQLATIQIARIGPHFITLRQDPGGSWQVHQRYHRPDMPQTLQAGLTVYTDWTTCDSVGYANHTLTSSPMIFCSLAAHACPVAIRTSSPHSITSAMRALKCRLRSQAQTCPTLLPSATINYSPFSAHCPTSRAVPPLPHASHPPPSATVSSAPSFTSNPTALTAFKALPPSPTRGPTKPTSSPAHHNSPSSTL